MAKFCISTDSGCDLPISLLNERDIVPLHVDYIIDDTPYEDTMRPEDCKAFYDMMRAGKLPHTSQINVVRFTEFWESLLDRNLPIVHICMGSGISGTFNNARLAADMFMEEHPETPVYLIDSTLASTGYGMLALKAAEMRDEGRTPEECVAWIEENKANVNTYYTTSDLTYLYRSGRVSKTGMVIAHALNINPVLKLDVGGHLLVTEKVRGQKATEKKIESIIRDLVVEPEKQTLYICHSDILEDAQIFGARLMESIGFKDVYYTYIGTTIGTNCGPGLKAAFFFGKPRT